MLQGLATNTIYPVLHHLQRHGAQGSRSLSESAAVSTVSSASIGKCRRLKRRMRSDSILRYTACDQRIDHSAAHQMSWESHGVDDLSQADASAMSSGVICDGIAVDEYFVYRPTCSASECSLCVERAAQMAGDFCLRLE
jgi:hypothetical protein